MIVIDISKFGYRSAMQAVLGSGGGDPVIILVFQVASPLPSQSA